MIKFGKRSRVFPLVVFLSTLLHGAHFLFHVTTFHHIFFGDLLLLFESKTFENVPFSLQKNI